MFLFVFFKFAEHCALNAVQSEIVFMEDLMQWLLMFLLCFVFFTADT